MARYGSRTIGQIIPGYGTIEAISLTAYKVDGTWVGFAKVDEMGWAEPLISDAGIEAVVGVLARS